ncbi:MULTISPECIES: hypothetical protein [unclassified Flavobacterium]|nr:MULTISPECIES: hypothetical protein [unclassified Flavobacterium]
MKTKKTNNEANQPNANIGTPGINKAYKAMLDNRSRQIKLSKQTK